MDEKIVYAALPKEDMDNMFDIMEGVAALMDKMAGDGSQGYATQTSAQEAADAIRLKIMALQLKVQTL